MKFHQDTIKLADDIILRHIRYDVLRRKEVIDPIDDLSINELCASLLSHNSDLACEATSIDNPHYEKIMLPALTEHLSDISNKDKRINFVAAWQIGIAKYLESIIDDLINERKESYQCAA